MASRERARRRKASLRAQAREVRRNKRQFRRRIVRSILIGFGGLGGIAIILSLVLPSSLGSPGNTPSSVGAGIQVAAQIAEKIEAGQDHPPYNTDPPTSGWYYDVPLEDIAWGAHSEPLEDEVQVFYLKRGGVMLQYSCPEECPDLAQQLEQVVSSYPEGVVLAPYINMDTAIALTSWGWIDTFQDFDGSRIEKFIQDHMDKGPESFQ